MRGGCVVDRARLQHGPKEQQQSDGSRFGQVARDARDHRLRAAQPLQVSGRVAQEAQVSRLQRVLCRTQQGIHYLL